MKLLSLAIVSLVFARGPSFADRAPASTFAKRCTAQHTALKAKCKKTHNISKERSVAASHLSFMYEGCPGEEIGTLFLDRIVATENAPSYLSCNLFMAGPNGTTSEIGTSLGTGLSVTANSREVVTTVVTRDGEITCKANITKPTDENQDNWWCGVMLKPATAFTEIKPPLASRDLTPAFYGKKALSEYLHQSAEATGIPVTK